MKRYLFMILIAVALSAGSVYAARCYRPAEAPVCSTPSYKPYCRTTTDTQANIMTCTFCHYEMWRHQA